ncbi:MAG: hypothetical protein P4L43_05110 [Syntrophobacteraceae bacterium]|nr:hypothetical protein [Syntrophobacteraceae bacterium]
MDESEPARKYSEAEIQEEDRRIRRLRRLVDFSLAFIAQSPLSSEEAQRVVQGVRRQATALFPGKEETFELLYAPRFRRLIAEKFRLM